MVHSSRVCRLSRRWSPLSRCSTSSCKWSVASHFRSRIWCMSCLLLISAGKLIMCDKSGSKARQCYLHLGKGGITKSVWIDYLVCISRGYIRITSLSLASVNVPFSVARAACSQSRYIPHRQLGREVWHRPALPGRAPSRLWKLCEACVSCTCHALACP